MPTTIICDCGHEESPHSDFTRGYGIDNEGKTVCYACCAKQDLEMMQATGKITLYFTQNSKNSGTVTNWPGSLKFNAHGLKHSNHNLAGRNGRTDFWFVVPNDPNFWHGVQIGHDNTMAHCKRTKEKHNYK